MDLRKQRSEEMFAIERLLNGKATKSARWIPWRQQPMKDAINCEKPREAVMGYDPRVSEWGNPTRVMSGDASLNT